MYKEENTLVEDIYEALCEGIKMLYRFNKEPFKIGQKNFICKKIDEEFKNILDLNSLDDQDLIEKIKNCLTKVFEYNDNETFNINKPPRIICPEKNQDKFSSLINNIVNSLKKNLMKRSEEITEL